MRQLERPVEGLVPDGQLRATTLRSGAFAAIRRGILAGRYPPGAKLVESELAAQLGVSRNPVREAISQLEQQGLLVSIPNRGTFVVQPSVEQAHDSFLLRAYLELLALRLAFTSWAPDRFAPLADVVADMRSLIRSVSALDGELAGRFNLLDTEFHTRLVQASGSAALLRAWETAAPTDLIFLYDRTRKGQGALSVEEFEGMVGRHADLLQAIESGDVRVAQAGLRSHFMATSREGTVSLDDVSLAILGWDQATVCDPQP
jgi:DNA-binding GntR family transcriptional regulator